MLCEEKERLLDTYLAALGAYYDARIFSLTRWLRRGAAAPRQQATSAILLDARCDYWWHLEQCGCSNARGQSGYLHSPESAALPASRPASVLQ